MLTYDFALQADATMSNIDLDNSAWPVVIDEVKHPRHPPAITALLTPHPPLWPRDGRLMSSQPGSLWSITGVSTASNGTGALLASKVAGALLRCGSAP